MPTLSSSSVNMDPLDDQSHYDRGPCRWRLQTCCLFISLRSGCYGISILSMVEALLYLFLSTSVLYFHLENNCSGNGDCKPNLSKGGHEHESLFSNYVTGAVITVMLIMCFYLLVSALLFYGVMKRLPTLLSPWLWWSIGEMLATFHSFTLMERTFSLLLKVYCCFVVCSYSEKLKEDQREEELVTYYSVRNNWSGGEGGAGRGSGAGGGGGGGQSGGPHFLGPGSTDIGASPSRAHHPPSHVFIPTASSQDDFLVKMESFNASRMYGGQRPPPYSPPLAGYIASTSSAAVASVSGISVAAALVAAEEGAVGGSEIVVTTAPASIMASSTGPAIADADAVAAVTGINSNNSMLPLLPPSYEEAISQVMPEYASDLMSPSLLSLPDEDRVLPSADTNTVDPMPDSLHLQQQEVPPPYTYTLNPIPDSLQQQEPLTADSNTLHPIPDSLQQQPSDANTDGACAITISTKPDESHDS